MSTVKVDAKGTIPLPRDVSETLDIKPGDTVEVTIGEDRKVILTKIEAEGKAMREPTAPYQAAILHEVIDIEGMRFPVTIEPEGGNGGYRATCLVFPAYSVQSETVEEAKAGITSMIVAELPAKVESLKHRLLEQAQAWFMEYIRKHDIDLEQLRREMLQPFTPEREAEYLANVEFFAPSRDRIVAEQAG